MCDYTHWFGSEADLIWDAWGKCFAVWNNKELISLLRPTFHIVMDTSEDDVSNISEEDECEVPEFQKIWLNRLWWSYIGPLLAFCHVSMTFSCFLIILATIERYLITKKSNYLQQYRNKRVALAAFMFTLALIVRGSAVFEIEVVRKANCTGLTEYEPMLTPLVTTWLYGTVFRFYLRNILT
uniref:G-protein coupled receptors family 1 profile domain-containing protein n=1 Tax=Parascaris equorum TaxID=6256 RepID=A0A914RR93_PAREQ